jgi:hypothetical protein
MSQQLVNISSFIGLCDILTVEEPAVSEYILYLYMERLFDTTRIQLCELVLARSTTSTEVGSRLDLPVREYAVASHANGSPILKLNWKTQVLILKWLL